jgi:hypothetical protein
VHRCVLSLLRQYRWYGAVVDLQGGERSYAASASDKSRLPLQQVKVVGTVLPLFLDAARRLVVCDGGSADETWYGTKRRLVTARRTVGQRSARWVMGLELSLHRGSAIVRKYGTACFEKCE